MRRQLQLSNVLNHRVRRAGPGILSQTQIATAPLTWRVQSPGLGGCRGFFSGRHLSRSEDLLHDCFFCGDLFLCGGLFHGGRSCRWCFLRNNLFLCNGLFHGGRSCRWCFLRSNFFLCDALFNSGLGCHGSLLRNDLLCHACLFLYGAAFLCCCFLNDHHNPLSRSYELVSYELLPVEYNKANEKYQQII